MRAGLRRVATNSGNFWAVPPIAGEADNKAIQSLRSTALSAAFEQRLHQTIFEEKRVKREEEKVGLRRVATNSSNFRAVPPIAGEADNKAIQLSRSVDLSAALERRHHQTIFEEK